MIYLFLYVIGFISVYLWDAFVGFGYEFDGGSLPPLFLVASFWPITIVAFSIIYFVSLISYFISLINFILINPLIKIKRNRISKTIIKKLRVNTAVVTDARDYRDAELIEAEMEVEESLKKY